MWENIVLAILGGGNIVVFIKFLIERHDRKKERAEDKADAKAEEENTEKSELTAIKDRLTKLEKDGIRTQLLLMILRRNQHAPVFIPYRKLSHPQLRTCHLHWNV